MRDGGRGRRLHGSHVQPNFGHSGQELGLPPSESAAIPSDRGRHRKAGSGKTVRDVERSGSRSPILRRRTAPVRSGLDRHDTLLGNLRSRQDDPRPSVANHSQQSQSGVRAK